MTEVVVVMMDSQIVGTGYLMLVIIEVLEGLRQSRLMRKVGWKWLMLWRWSTASRLFDCFSNLKYEVVNVDQCSLADA